jgi:4-hydroxybenzoate polyprenyltransferase
VAAGAGVGVVGSLALGPATLLVGLLGYALGVAYDLRLKGTAWGWLCLALALPLVPVYAWLGVDAGLPPTVGMLFLLGGLAGVELAIANGLVDAPADGRIGRRGIAIRLGPEGARVVMAAAAAGVLGLAWLLLFGPGMGAGPPPSGALVLALLVGTLILVGGVAMSLRRDPAWSWRGWQVQAFGVAVVALVWLASAGGGS